MTKVDSKVRILHVVQDLGLGGIEKIILNLGIKMNNDEFHTSVLATTAGGILADRIAEHNIDLKILNLNNYHSPIQVYKLASEIKKINPDILHCHAYFANTFARLANFSARVPAVFAHVHTLDISLKKRHFFIDNFLNKFTTKIICCSEAAQKYMLEHESTNPDKFTILYNSAEDHFFENTELGNVRNDLGIPKDHKVIGTVGRLVEAKGYDLFIDSAASILKKNPEITFIIIGEGNLKESIENQAKKLGIDKNIIFIGRVDDTIPYLKAMDLFMICSSREGLGIAAIEAMATGLPVVCANTGGLPEVVEDGKSGYVIPDRNPENFAQACLELINNNDKIDIMGKAARERALNTFSNNAFIESLEKLYLESLK